MSSQNEQVQPTPFDVVQPAPLQQPAATAAAAAKREGTPAWVLPALGGLLLLALLVIFWLPERVNTQATVEPATVEGTAAGAAQGASPATAQPGQAGSGKPDATPWSDAQLAKLRKEAQDVLAELLELQFALEEQGVKVWAPEPFAAVAALAAAGDELYKTREYAEAKARYEEGLAQLQALQAGIPAALARQLELAGAALEQGDLAQANTALDLAEAIDPGNTTAAALRQRVKALPQLLELLAQATTLERNGDLPGAAALLQQAAALDPQHQRSRDELQRVTTAYREQQFNEAMSAGYAALDASQFDKARKAFRRAAQLQSGSSEAASALQEVETAATAHRLAGLQASGLRHEQAEQWQQAVSAYEQAQQIDANVLFAREGLARSRDRARLDKQFQAAIDEPGRLSDQAVSAATEQLLQQARKISPRGPVLARQLERLETLLRQANTTVAVSLRSDQQTEVTVYKVAKLGRFQQHELSLRPGTYTAVGSRIGYRDVRVDITVKADSAPAPITIACTEAI